MSHQTNPHPRTANRANERSGAMGGRRANSGKIETVLRQGLALVFLISARLAAFVSRRLAGRLALAAFCTPLGRRASTVPAGAKPFVLHFRGRRLMGWKAGQGPAVYLVHGWAGSAGQLTAWVDGLVSRGFSVVAVDQPGHGASQGLQTNAPEMAAVLHELSHRVGRPAAIVAHSLGGLVTGFAIKQGLRPRALVLIGSPDEAQRYFRKMLAMGRMGGRDDVMQGAEELLGHRFADFGLGQQLGGLPTFVAHDHEDREVPLACRDAIVAQVEDVEVMTTQGLGHKRILADAAVQERAMDFIAERVGDLTHFPTALSPVFDPEAPLYTAEEVWADLVYGQR